MTADTELKYKALKNHLLQLERVVVAFSGGVDSSLLAKVSRDVLGDNAVAVTLVSPMIPAWDLADAESVASQIGVEHILLETNLMQTVKDNVPNRCYHCKKEGLKAIVQLAKEKELGVVIEGSNADDTNDYRPGTKAIEELKILSPLKTAGFNKQEIRALSKALGLPTWNKPAYACLATRIPCGSEITADKLKKIEMAEMYLHSLGYLRVRVRVHGEVARIELAPEDRKKFCNPQTMDRVSRQLKAYGFTYVSLELEGYAMGSLNRELTTT